MGWERFGEPDLTPLAGHWQAAFDACPASVFQSFAFARNWAAVFCRDVELQIWVQNPGPLVLPFALRNGQLGLIGEGLFDYLDLVGLAPPQLLLEAVEKVSGLDWRSAQFTGVPAASPHAIFWKGLNAECSEYAAAPWRPAPDPTFGDHARWAVRWRAAQAELQLETGPAERRRLLAWLLDRKARALAARGAANVLGACEQRWLAAMVEHEPHIAELWALRRRGELLAALLAWQTPTMRYAYTLSYEQRAAALSPGLLLLYALVRYTMNQGRGFNFLTGEQSFKLRLATLRDPLLRYRRERT